jgi:hypothetical protein
MLIAARGGRPRAGAGHTGGGPGREPSTRSALAMGRKVIFLQVERPAGKCLYDPWLGLPISTINGSFPMGVWDQVRP